MRIVSLLPSATDIVASLGAGDQLVGVSHSCGAEWTHLPQLTSTWLNTAAPAAEIDQAVSTTTRPLYELNVDLLDQLKPDVVVSQSLCDVCAVPSGDVYEAVEQLSSKPRLVDLAPATLADVPNCFSLVGEAIESEAEAHELLKNWHELFDSYHHRHADTDLKIAFLDWVDPPFAAGHWVPDLIEWLGAKSVLAQSGEPSYKVTWEAVAEAKPDLTIAACCGFTAQRTLAEQPQVEVTVVDGYELFSRPSPTLRESLVILDEVICVHLSKQRA